MPTIFFKYLVMFQLHTLTPNFNVGRFHKKMNEWFFDFLSVLKLLDKNVLCSSLNYQQIWNIIVKNLI